MLKYDFNFFQELVKNISSLANATTTFYDQNFVSTSIYHRSKQITLCGLIKNIHTVSCLKSDHCAMKQAVEMEESAFYYSCHFGFIEMCFRLGNKNAPLGYILIGPFRPAETTDTMLQQIKELAEKNNKPYDKTLRIYKTITKFSIDHFTALKNIIYPLFEYMEQKHLIHEVHGYFTNTIEPFILNNLKQDLSIPYLCDSLFLTQKQLYTIFQKNVHKTPKQYINQIRVQEAKKLLLSTEKSLSEISALVGFPDYNYFIKLFKAQTGVTPFHFRKEN